MKRPARTVTDRERSLLTWLMKIMDESAAERDRRAGSIEAEPFQRLYQHAFDALDRPTRETLRLMREGHFE